MKRKMVWVRWKDAAADSHRYLEAGEGYDPLVTLETVGFLVSSDANALTLAVAWNEESQRWRGIVGIPTPSVMKKRVWTVK